MTISTIYKGLQYRLGKLRARMYSLFPDIKIGENTCIERRVFLSTKNGGHIKIGNNCYISEGAQVITEGGNIIIGNNCTINPCSVVYGQGGTTIGNGVRIAAQCVIVPSNHIFENPDEFIWRQGLSKRGIIIEDDVWLGAGVKILDGVTVSKGTVIGANAVVTHNTEPYGVYVGVPAKLIKRRK